ncbi:MAG: tRNA (adenosine(37)-N6)-threonylcarbamoyltransferase complex dimerization subunit type 1 TsaB [Paludibacteraceae bacterium]|nr:tRNA (adenosine(37)-N6)-threonylcarbamoyltransferase complex dimerization subunit type 1 TsaB [Paludibacteraceae bacterium]
MTILCIETSTSVCSAAICKDGEPISQCICREGSNHARLLPRYIQQLLDEARQKGLAIQAVALSEGPGSYTGLRIGTSTAKGLCYGLNIPLIPVPTLQVLCEAAKRELSPLTTHLSPLLIPMIDARRMEVYTMINGETKAVVVENEESFNLQPSTFSVYYFGDGAAKCQAVFSRPNWHFIPNIVPEAQYVGVLAEQIINNQSPIANHQLAYYEPYYLKEFVAAQSHVKGLK